MKRMIALVLSLVMAMSLCISPAWGAEDATEQAAQEFVNTYLSNDDGSIYGHVKGFDGSLSKMLNSEGAWNELDAAVQTRVNELVDAAHSGLSYETLLEWTQGFMFMVEYLVVAEGDYEGYIISTDPNGGTLVDPDPEYNTYAIHPFTYEIWQRIVGAEDAFNVLSDAAKTYLERLMTEEGFGLNNEVQPADLPICNFTELLVAAKENLAATEQAAQEFVDNYLSNDGVIFEQVKGYDGSLSKMLESESAWNELGEDVQSCVNELVDAAQPGLSYETLLEWTQGFMFMVEYLVIAEGDYEGYIISTDPNGGTLVDPDPPHGEFAVQPFTQEIWRRIVAAEDAFNALSDDAKAYLERLMTEEGFGLNNEVQPADLPICNFTQLLEKAKENLAADDVEQAAQEFIDTYLSNDGVIFEQVKGYDGSLGKMLESESAWNELDEEVQSRVNELVDAAHPGLSYETLLEWTRGFMFMVEYLVIAEDNYEGYIISTDPNGGTLVDPDPPHAEFAVHPFTHEIWQRIVAAEEAFNALSDDAKAYLEKLMTEEGFGLNNGIQPADLPICNFTQLLEKAVRNLTAYEDIGSTLEELPIVPAPEVVNQMPDAMVEAITDGKKVEIEVKTEMVVKDTVDEDKQAAFEKELKEWGYTGYSIDRYLEIEVLMTVQGFDPVLASRTVKPIWIDLGEAKSGFDYAVLREHAGELTLLVGNQYVVVRGDGHVYVKSDLFSTYAVVEKPKTTGGYVGGYVSMTEETEPTVVSADTFDAGVSAYVATAILSLTGMAWTNKRRK